MKKIASVLSLLLIFALTGCRDASSIGIIGGSDGPTAILVDDDMPGVQEKEPVKAVIIDGSLYYETGEDREYDGRKELDGTLTRTVDAYEIPTGNNEANFNVVGYALGQMEDTVEIQVGDDWEVFLELYDPPGFNLTDYKYIMKLEGKNEEYTVLSDSMDITVADVVNSTKTSAEDDGFNIYVIATEFD